MSELELVVNNKVVEHVGMFNYAETLSLIKSEIHDLGYSYREKRNEQIVDQHGRNIYLELRCEKQVKQKISAITIRLNINGMHDLQKNKVHAQAGKVSIHFDAWIKAEHTHGLDRRPLVMLVTTIFDKLVYPIKNNPVREAAINDTRHIINVLRNVMSRYKKRDPAYYNVQEIQEQINAEIDKELNP